MALLCAIAACSPEQYRTQADRTVADILREKQQQAKLPEAPIYIERPSDTLRRRVLAGQRLPVAGDASWGVDRLKRIEHWPDDAYAATQPAASTQPAGLTAPWSGTEPLRIGLLDALQIGARNSRQYQAQKEAVFLAALDLDLERQAFRFTFNGVLSGLLDSDHSSGEPVTGVVGTARGGVTKQLESGAFIVSQIGVDLAQLLSSDQSSSVGFFGDASISIPLMRGAGEHIVTEPLTQADRNVVYALWTFDRYKRSFVVQIATQYLQTLQSGDRLANAEENYRRLLASSRRSRRLADAGRLPEFQVDQAVQNELRSRDRWISAKKELEDRLDDLKELLGLPTDANIVLDRTDLERLGESRLAKAAAVAATQPAGMIPPADAPIELVEPNFRRAGPLEMDATAAVTLALKNRLDLRVLAGEVYDAQRRVVVAADALGAELTLLGTAAVGERRAVSTARERHGYPRFDRAAYAALLTANLPLERTAERNAYRESFVDLERAVRAVQEGEDLVKNQVREELRRLMQSRESLEIQAQSVALARRRVASTDLFLQAGRAQVRDLLEAQDALLSAQNSFTSALVSYRVAELELQRDMEVLEVDESGLWREYEPPAAMGANAAESARTLGREQ